MTVETAPVLSVIVPLLNEAPGLAALFETLSAQRGVFFEGVFCDGGSTDGTLARARELAGRAPFPCRILTTEKGRGRQLNAGARAARGRIFLFLHADSRFFDSWALRKALTALGGATATGEGERVAGHFSLRFCRSGNPPPALSYTFYEWKARLNRPGCTHGDQGFLISRSFFEQVGPFETSLPILEDTRLAEKVRSNGRWMLFPVEIGTSARRFETEGFFERQVLNALLRGAAAADWTPFFRELAGLYRSQDGARRLRLSPFFRRIGELLRATPRRERLALWGRIGGYVAGQGWQLPFALDVRRHFRRAAPVGEGRTPLLDAYDRLAPFLIDHSVGRRVASVLVWVAFHLLWGASRWRDEKSWPKATGTEERS